MAEPPLLEVSDIETSYGQSRVLFGISFAIAPGAVACNKCGSARCRYATTPADTTISAKPAMVRCPIIMAGIVIRKG